MLYPTCTPTCTSAPSSTGSQLESTARKQVSSVARIQRMTLDALCGEHIDLSKQSNERVTGPIRFLAEVAEVRLNVNGIDEVDRGLSPQSRLPTESIPPFRGVFIEDRSAPELSASAERPSQFLRAVQFYFSRFFRPATEDGISVAATRVPAIKTAFEKEGSSTARESWSVPTRRPKSPIATSRPFGPLGIFGNCLSTAFTSLLTDAV